MSGILLKCLKGGKGNGAVLPSVGMAGSSAGAEDCRGCAMGEELSHGSISTWSSWQSSVLLGFSFVENFGIFHSFLKVCSGISHVTSMSGVGNTSQPGQDLFFLGSKASSAPPKPSLQGHDQVRVIFKASTPLFHGLSFWE